MKKTCTKFKMTASGKRCARFSTNEEQGGKPEHSMVKLSLQGYGLLNKSVNSTDVLLGALIGTAGSGGVKWAVRALGLQDKLPVLIQNWMPLIGSSLAGTAAYMLQGRSQKAYGHLVGAVAAGAAAQAWGLLKSQYPEYFGDVVALRFQGYARNGMGVLVRNPSRQLGGMLFRNPTRQLSGANMARYADKPHMAGLAAAAMGDDASGLEEMMD